MIINYIKVKLGSEIKSQVVEDYKLVENEGLFQEYLEMGNNEEIINDKVDLYLNVHV